MFASVNSSLSVVKTTSIFEHRLSRDPQFCQDVTALAIAQILGGIVSFDISILPNLRADRANMIRSVLEEVVDIPNVVARFIASREVKPTSCDNLVLNAGIDQLQKKIDEMQQAGVFFKELHSNWYYLSNKFR
jgi:hypothetical protein